MVALGDWCTATGTKMETGPWKVPCPTCGREVWLMPSWRIPRHRQPRKAGT